MKYLKQNAGCIILVYSEGAKATRLVLLEDTIWSWLTRCHYDLRKHSFAVRVWNSLPDSVISANNVNTFKNRLDKFWANQELIFEYL